MSKQPPPAPTASAVGPCPTEIQIVGCPGTRSLPSTIAPPDHPLQMRSDNKDNYTCGQVSVNKRISVLSSYFDVSFEIYYVRLKYIDSIGQVVQLLILRPASICCTFNSGHVGSPAPNVNKMGCLFYFHTFRVRLKHKYLFRSRKKEIIILHSINAHVRCTIQLNAAKAKVRLKFLDV